MSAETDLGNVYETESLTIVREWFNACHRERWIAVLYGPPGSGKTFGIRHCLAEFNRDNLRRETANRAFYLRATHGMAPLDLLQGLCAVAGAPRSSRIQGCLRALRLWLGEYHVLFALDEMQGVPLDTFEVMRELHDEAPHAGMVIAGSHKLNTFLKRHAGELEQWNSRIDVTIALPAISAASATSIIRGELPRAGEQNVAALLNGSKVADMHNGGKTYTSLRRLTDNITKRQQRLAEQQEVTQ